ncbi:Rqc2 family fibronectin-binding protein [Paenibacillus massiliensis]|uniref:Rqc2 family fibronectin-binding protein n=1 Tax=Paenibacillus massiliensis TaxID=225917 RepID=UPI00041AF405|nr:NFACT RNA binding domain-containing protein [Paenibacillus massiliensis]
MALDGIVTRALVAELQSYIGARIHKIYQPNERDIVLNLRVNRGNDRLLLSANPTYPRVHLTDRTFTNPPEAPMFCMLLRKHCEGGFIEQIRQIGMERIIHIDIRQRDELGDMSSKRLIIELMGRHSNIVLVDPATGTILDGIHHVTPAISSYRVIMPGFAYVEPPQQHKLDPLAIGEAGFLQARREQQEEEAARWIVNAFTGISPLVASEIVLRASDLPGQQSTAASAVTTPANESSTAHTSGEDRSTSGGTNTSSSIAPEQLWQAFSDMMEQVRERHFTPVSGLLQGSDKMVFSAIRLTLTEEHPFESISACMEDFYGEKAERDSVKQKVSDLLRFLQNERNKNIKKLDHLNKDLEEAEDADQYRIYGELLFASLHQISKGDKKVTLINYYDEEQTELTIDLDPLLTPSDNAQRYFKKYNKYKNSLAVIHEQLAKTHEEIRYMDNLLQQLAHASMSDIDEIREELIQQGYLRDRAKKGKKKKKTDRPTLHLFTSSEGIDLYVGKNNLQNEYVTNRLAGPNDTWLHTKDIPGSHVVIRAEQYGEATLEEAAQLAAYYSQAKQSSSVPVDYTLIRHVKKPSGAKPGFVIYDNQRTLFITPDEQTIKQLPVRLKQM